MFEELPNNSEIKKLELEIEILEIKIREKQKRLFSLKNKDKVF